MNLNVILLATILSGGTLIAQESRTSGALAQNTAQPGAKRDQAVTAINDKGAKPKGNGTAAAASDDDSTVIKAAGGRKAAGKPAESGEGMNLWELVRKGGWPLWVLGAMSVVTGMLIFVMLFSLRRGAIVSAAFMNQADVLLRKRDYLGLLAVASRSSEVIARVVQRTLDFMTKNPSAPFEAVREVAETEGSAQASDLQHRPGFLGDIGMLSPMVGLLGTVIGIMSSFGELSRTQGESRSREVLLAGGVAEALLATAGGLIVGIISFAFYSMFRNKVQSLISDLETATTHIISTIAVNYQKKDRARAVAVEEEEF